MNQTEVIAAVPPPVQQNDANETDGTHSLSISHVVGLKQNSIVGALASAVVHMVLLIVAGLLFASVRQDDAMDLQMSVANTSSTDSIETLSVDIDLSVESPESSDVVSVSESFSSMSIAEPTLVSDFGNVAASDEQDAMTPLSEPTDVAGGKDSGEKSSQKGSFFGADAYGDEFVYVVDMSTSMGFRSQYGQTRFRVACRELLRSIKDLTPQQKFCVFMFSYRTRVMFDDRPRMIPATAANKQRVSLWINGLGLGAGTDPRYGTMMALKLKPDAIFLLSDGEFNGRDVNTHGIRGNVSFERVLVRHRKDTVPIHTIAFEDMLNRKRLRSIATSTHGTHRFVGNVSDQELLIDDLRSRNPRDNAYGLRSIVDGTQKIRDDQHLLRATKLIASKFTSDEHLIRELALDAMVKLAGEDTEIGPADKTASRKEFAAAKKEWLDYWSDHFEAKRDARKLSKRSKLSEA